MICLLQFLFWECWKGKRYLECKGKDCRFYGSDTCYAKDGDTEYPTREYIIRETTYPDATKQEVIGELVRCKDCLHNRACEIQYHAQAGDLFFCGAAERKDGGNG